MNCVLQYFNRNLYSILARHCSTWESPLRVRFAPSPTGQLHFGGFRTALFNHLFARANQGKFVLRIEDTDQVRLVPGSAERLEELLHWAGIGPDESPLIGGRFGPYRQSERLAFYSKYTEQLIASGHAYRCYCTERRLELLKKEAARTKTVNKYDRKCLFLSEKELQEKIASKMPYTVRFKLSPHPEPFNDLVYGKVTHDVFELEGDPIIVKSDGFPTYHFANVVDDHLMQITHVLRGAEWQVSTPKHLLLYKALGWEPPHFAHLPLLLNKDGTKLSKRQGDLHVENLRRSGIYPESIMNFVTLVGGGFDEKEYSLEKVFSKNELIKTFNISKVSTHSGRLEMERLDIFNRLVLKQKLNDQPTRLNIIEESMELIREASVEKQFDMDYIDEKTIEKYLRWAEDRIVKLTDIVSEDFLFLWIMPKKGSLVITLSNDFIRKVIVLFEETPANGKILLSRIRQLGKEENLKFPMVMKDLRTLITGREEGPPVMELLEVLGTDNVVRRLENFVSSS